MQDTQLKKDEIMIGWSFPVDDWIKPNTNRSSIDTYGLVGGEGALRDATGIWIDGFAINIGIYNFILVEL